MGAGVAGLKAPLGVHAILGNHDWWDDRQVQREGQGPTVARRALEAAGIPVYENDAQRIFKDGRAFWLAGLGDQLAYVPARRFRPVRHIGVDDLAKTMAKITDDAPVILMAHEPDVAWRGAVARRATAFRAYPWRSGASVRVVAGGAFRTKAGLWPYPPELRCHRFRRSWLQHDAVPPRRPAGDRSGDVGWGRAGDFIAGNTAIAASVLSISSRHAKVTS